MDNNKTNFEKHTISKNTKSFYVFGHKAQNNIFLL
jgi:hypothetical protein